ncbi:MAG: hypothetical protein JNM41_01695 [Flavipsychrobacter sp.]|nr:hypothetical protein [Flavipsychrobacter sp.]
MKYILTLFISLVIAATMQAQPVTNLPLGRAFKPEKPFIQLKDQPKIYADTVRFLADMRHDIMVAGGKQYDTKDVLRYSDGKGTYLWHKDEFIKCTYDGKIRAYRAYYEYVSSSTSGGFTYYTPHTAMKYILEDSATGRLSEVEYKTLRNWIPANAPGSRFLDMYKRGKRRNTLIFLGGAATMLGGFILVGKSINMDGAPADRMATSGAVLIGGGVVGTLWGFFGGGVNKFKLPRAVAEYNGMDPYGIDADYRPGGY